MERSLLSEEEPMYLVGGTSPDLSTVRRLLERFDQMDVVQFEEGKRREVPDNLEIP